MDNHLDCYVPKKTTKEQQQERIDRIRAALEGTSGVRDYQPDSVAKSIHRVAKEHLLATDHVQKSAQKVVSTATDTAIVVDDLIRDGLGTLSITTLAEIMEDAEGEIDPSVRARVAQYVVDRILGKPTERKEIKTEINQKSVVINMGQVANNVDLKEMGLIYDETAEV